MEGWELYELYVKYNQELNNCLCDTWDAMDQKDRNVWNAMAENLPE